MKLNLEICVHGSVAVIYCRGRIAYREEAAMLSERVAELLPRSRCLVLELSGVEMIDSAGLGELAGIQLWARAAGCSVRLVAPRKHVRKVLELTKLATVLEIHSTLEAAAPGADRWPSQPSALGDGQRIPWEEVSTGSRIT